MSGPLSRVGSGQPMSYPKLQPDSVLALVAGCALVAIALMLSF